jgi:hypothetical protein
MRRREAKIMMKKPKQCRPNHDQNILSSILNHGMNHGRFMKDKKEGR